MLTLVLCFTMTAEKPAEAVRVLVITGVDHPAHHWQSSAPALRQVLEKDRGISVRIIEDPEILGSNLVFDYDVLVVHFKNFARLKRQAEAQKNLAGFVERGGGLVVLHFGCGAFEDWPEYANLAGRVWDQKNSHDPRGPFTVRVVDRNHPITRNLGDFETDDELYICLKGDRPIDLLATARSKVTRRDHPMAFAFDYGKGKVFHTTLGHDARAMQTPAFGELVRRGTLWTAGRL